MASGESIIQQVLGVTEPEDIVGSYDQATRTLTGHDADIDLDERLLRERNPANQDELERLYDARALTEILIRREIRSANTLVDWDVYRRLMRAYGTKADGTATALCIGALSPLSARSFVCLAQAEYGANKAIIVDLLTGHDKARHGVLLRGNGTRLPLRDGSIDFVHTNQLLHALRDPSDPGARQWDIYHRLFTEAARVLAPGGQLLMKEQMPGYKEMDPSKAHQYGRKVIQLLGGVIRDAGFDAGGVDWCLMNYTRDPSYLHGTPAQLDEMNLQTNLAALEIYARKGPNRREPEHPFRISTN